MSSALLRSLHAGVCSIAIGFAAQFPNPNQPDIRVQVDLVLVPVSAFDQRGASVTTLDRSNFRVFENSVEQPIVSFSREDAPCSVVLVLDSSGSMQDKMAEAGAAAEAFLSTLNPEDEILLMQFSGRPVVSGGFVRDAANLRGALPFLRAGGGTALVDAVWQALDRMRDAQNPRKAIVLVSDGKDNFSRHSMRELMRRAMESDVQIYTIAIPDSPARKKPVETVPDREGVLFLEELALGTGGVAFSVAGVSDAGRTAEQSGLAIRNLYVLGYAPAASGGGWRKIRLQVDVPRVRLYSRGRYFAPAW